MKEDNSILLSFFTYSYFRPIVTLPINTQPGRQVNEDDLRNDLARLQRSLDRIYSYLQQLPVLDPVSGDVACLERMMDKWRFDDDREL